MKLFPAYENVFGSGLVEISWQRDNQGSPNWYGRTFAINSDRLDMIEFSAKLAKKLEFNGWNLKPADLVDKLHKLGFQEVGYHSGTHRYYPVNSWPKDAKWGIRDDENRLQTSFIAYDEYEAKQVAKKYVSECIAHSWKVQDFWISWLKNM